MGSANAQLQQQFVYTTGGAIATRNDATGVLAPTAASPLAGLGYPAVLDAKGRFLFAAGNNSIHMYQVDSVTGSYTEVPGSPFASAYTNSPTLIATEPTGAYLAVVNSIGLNPGESSAESFQINAAAGALVPISGSFLELVSTPIGAAANPATGTFYVYLGPNPLSPNPDYQQDGDLLTYTINPLTGLLGNETGLVGSPIHGRSFSADPLGRFVVTGQGELLGTLLVTSATGVQGLLSLGTSVFADEIFVGPGQRFIYVTVVAGPNSVVHIYIVDNHHVVAHRSAQFASSLLHFACQVCRRSYRPVRLSEHRSKQLRRCAYSAWSVLYLDRIVHAVSRRLSPSCARLCGQCSRQPAVHNSHWHGSKHVKADRL